MNIESKELSEQVVRVDVILSKEDFYPEFEKQIKKYQSTVQLKGFRKGNIPKSVILGYYGNQLFLEIINKVCHNAFLEHCQEENYNIIGEPNIIDSSLTDSSKYNNTDQVKVVYEFGTYKMAEFDELNRDTPIEIDKIVLEESKLSDLVNGSLRHLDTEELYLGDLDDKCILNLSFTELRDADTEADHVLIECLHKLPISELTNDVKKNIIETGREYTFEGDVTEFLYHLTRQQIVDRVFNLEHSDTLPKNCLVKIEEVYKYEKVEYTDEMASRNNHNFEVNSMQELREKTKDYYESMYSEYSEIHNAYKFFDSVYELNKDAVQIPEEFLYNLLKSKTIEGTQQMNDLDIQNELIGYKKSLMMKKFAQHYKVNITDDQVIDFAYKQFISHQPYIQFLGQTEVSKRFGKYISDNRVALQAKDSLYYITLFSSALPDFNIKFIERSTQDYKELLNAQRDQNEEIHVHNENCDHSIDEINSEDHIHDENCQHSH